MTSLALLQSRLHRAAIYLSLARLCQARAMEVLR